VLRAVAVTSGERFALGSMVAGCLVLGLKAAAWWLTGSAALYSDALESTANSAAGAIEAHDLRTRHAGRLTFLEFHLAVPGSMTVAAAHQICDRIEDALKAEMGHLMITIHVEPEEKARQGGVPVL
jgi:divalent metal cation (Fe/Co/Zn/Cd) transporter